MTENQLKTILVVDDDPQIVSFIRRRLEANNYKVKVAYDGVQALEKIDAEAPDLILLDILMPRMDGSQFLMALKQKGLMEKIPVIVLSAKVSMREFFLVKEVAKFMVKPFSSDNLLDEIARHVGSDISDTQADSIS